MEELEDILICLEKSPVLLEKLIQEIPLELQRQRRIPEKWSIHEHACHIVDVQTMLIDRIKRFMEEKEVKIKAYLPGVNADVDHLMNMDLAYSLLRFHELRREMTELARSVDESVFAKTAVHPEYKIYSLPILFRHILMHDHTHMYRIEELWLTKDEFLPTP